MFCPTATTTFIAANSAYPMKSGNLLPEISDQGPQISGPVVCQHSTPRKFVAKSTNGKSNHIESDPKQCHLFADTKLILYCEDAG